MSAVQQIYKVIFYNQNQIYEVYARNIYQSELFGFIELEEMLFGERSSMLVDPSEERLKNEFHGVQRSYIPVQSIVRIDEVDQQGVAKIREGDANGNVHNLPLGSRQGRRD